MSPEKNIKLRVHQKHLELASDTSGTGSRAISPEALRIVQFGRLARALKICISKMLGVMLKLRCRAGNTGLEDGQLLRMTPSATWLIISPRKAERALKVHLVLVC